MASWLNRLKNRENWVSFAVRLGLDAFARECVGGAPESETGRERDSLPGAALPNGEARPSIP